MSPERLGDMKLEPTQVSDSGFGPRGIYSVALIMPASQLVRQVSAPRNLFGRLAAQGAYTPPAAVGQRGCGGTAGHLRNIRASPGRLGCCIRRSALRHSGKFAVAADSAARRPAPAPADGGDTATAAALLCATPRPRLALASLRLLFGDHGGRWCSSPESPASPTPT